MASPHNHIDRLILIAVLFLMVVGVGVVYSASSTWAQQKLGATSGLVNRHIIKVMAGILVMFAATKIDYHWYKRISKLAVTFSLFLLVITLVLGGEVKGASRWLSILGFSLQPSEFAKFALILHLSALIAMKKDRIEDLKKGYLPMLLWISSVVFLVMVQPNFSTGAIIFLLGMMMMFVGGARMKHLFYSFLALAPLALLYMLSAPYRMQRVLSFIGFSDHSGATSRANYQLWQGIIGFGNGGFFGVGMGASKQRDLFLPESYGDFVFSIVGEEYGFIGTAIFMILFLTILLRGLRVARNSPDDFGRYLAIGITTTIVAYALGNALVTLGLAPTTGLPMPFVSYGGSAIVFSSLAVGVLLNISSQTDLHPRAPMIFEESKGAGEPAVGRVY